MRSFLSIPLALLKQWLMLALSKTSNAHKHSAAHIQEKKSSYTAMPTARQKILSTSWNVQFVVFNTSEKLNNNLVNA
jgi:hypothetical protein